MAQVYVIYVRNGNSNRDGVVGHHTDLSTMPLEVKYTPTLNIKGGTLAFFSRRRAEQISNEIASKVKQHYPDVDFTTEVRSENIPDSLVQTAMEKRMEFENRGKKPNV